MKNKLKHKTENSLKTHKVSVVGEVGLSGVYGGKGLWKRQVLSVERKNEAVIGGDNHSRN